MTCPKKTPLWSRPAACCKTPWGPHILAINGGVDGYNTFQQLAYYRYHGTFLQPDVVVLCFFVGNDFRDNAVGTQRGGDLNPVLVPQALVQKYKDAPDPFLRDQHRALLRDPLSGAIVPKPARGWAAALQQKSLLARLLGARYARAKGRWTSDLWLLDLDSRYYFYEIGSYQRRAHPLIELTRNLTLDCIAQMRYAVEADGAEFAVAILPSQNQVDPAHWRRTLELLDVEEADLGPLHLPQPNRLIGEFCAERQINYLDLLDTFAAADRPADLYLSIIQDLHFSPAGHQLAARQMANFLLDHSVFLTNPAIDAYRHGLSRLHSGDLTGAEVHLRSSVEARPKWLPPRLALGDLYQRTGMRHQALESYRQALGIDPLSLCALDGMGQVLLASADTSAALALYVQALKVRPGWVPFYAQLRDLYVSRSNQLEAERITYRLQALLDSGDRATRYWLADYNFMGEFHTRQQQLPRAEQMYRRALELDPASEATWNNLADLLQRQQQTATALAAYEQALQHDSLNLKARTNRATIYYKLALRHKGAKEEQSYNQKALEETERVLAVDSTYKEALNNLSSIYRALGRDQAAETILLKSIAAHPDYATAYFNLGGLYAQQKKYEAAIRQYHKAIDLEPHKAAHYYAAGIAHLLLGKLSEAEKAVRQAHTLNTQEVNYLHDLADILLLQGEREMAVDNRDSAAEKWREAQAYYRQITALNPQHQAATARLHQLADNLAEIDRKTPE